MIPDFNIFFFGLVESAEGGGVTLAMGFRESYAPYFSFFLVGSAAAD